MDIEYLKTRKKQIRMTFDEIAELSGLPKSTVTNVFMGTTKHPRIDTLQAIERALGIETKNPPDNLSGGAAEWMELYNTLTDENKDLLVSMVKVFAELPPERRRFVLDAIRLAGDNQK